MENKYPFDWQKAFNLAMDQGNRRLLDEHFEKVRQFVLMPALRSKAKSNDDANEVASMVVSKFWERFFVKEEPLPDNVNGYLYTMANNAFYHFSKMKDKQQKLVIGMDISEMNQALKDKTGDQPDFSSRNVHEEKESLLTAMETAFQKLEDKCRRLLQMFIYEKRKMKDIHKILGIPTANAATKKKESCINNLKKLTYKEIRN